MTGWNSPVIIVDDKESSIAIMAAFRISRSSGRHASALFVMVVVLAAAGIISSVKAVSDGTANELPGFEEFQPLDGSADLPQFNKVEIDPQGIPRRGCSAAAVWTIVPGSTFAIKTVVGNLWTPVVRDGTLQFKYNCVSSNKPAKAGVLIEMPAEALTELSVGAQDSIVVLAGFVGLRKVNTFGQAELVVESSLVAGAELTMRGQTRATFTDVAHAVHLDLEEQVTAKLMAASSGLEGSVRGRVAEMATLDVESPLVVEGLDVSDMSTVYSDDCSNVNTDFMSTCEQGSAEDAPDAESFGTFKVNNYGPCNAGIRPGSEHLGFDVL